jgi:predicted RNase H-like nuclease (RuvC/YqgF family)
MNRDTVLRELTRELCVRDAEARRLRDEVLLLEKANNANAIAWLDIADSASMAEGAFGAQYPIEFVDELQQKINEAKVAIGQYRDALNQRQLSREEMLRKKMAVEERQKELDVLYSAAKWKPGSKVGYECPIQLRDEASMLRSKMVGLCEEHSACETTLRRQTEELIRLTELIASHSGAEEALFKAQERLKLLQSEYNDVAEEIQSLHRILKRKDRMLERSQRDNAGSASRVRHCEAAKRVAHAKLQSHQDHVRQNDVAIRHRALQIAKLSKRIELIADAIGGDEGAAAPPVEVDVVNDVRKEVDELTKEQVELDRELSEVDREIEDLEGRIKTLSRAAQVAEDEEQRVRRNHERLMQAVEKHLIDADEEAKSHIMALQREIEQLKCGRSSSKGTDPARGQ